MNEAIEVALVLARRVVNACAASEDLMMAFVTGSVARGLADAASDIDIYLYSEHLDPMVVDRPDRLRHLGGARLLAFPTATGWFEKHRVGERLVDIERLTINSLDVTISALQQPQALTADAEKTLAGVRDAVPIVGDDVLVARQRQLEYSGDLARVQAQAHLPALRSPVALWRLTFARGDRLSFAARLSATMLEGIALLGAVNREFVVITEPKWIPWQVERFDLVPERMMDRITDAFSEPTMERMEDLRRLLEEIVTLVEANVADVRTAAARFALGLES